ncbi:MAG: hypothetical protein HY288_18470 [Planctomycetia bacterium]|nr:hypothetical protein [Planctomycetia bacterium]
MEDKRPRPELSAAFEHVQKERNDKRKELGIVVGSSKLILSIKPTGEINPLTGRPAVKVSSTVVSEKPDARQAFGFVIGAALSEQPEILRSACFLCCALPDECLDAAARYFASPLAEMPCFGHHEHLPEMVIYFHRFDADKLPDLVARTCAFDRAAGDRLRAELSDALDDPLCADEIGVLGVQALRERLETV